MTDITTLRALAAAATPGEWRYDGLWGIGVYAENGDWRPVAGTHVDDERNEQSFRDADYILGARPTVLSPLLDELETLREENIELRNNAWPFGKRPNPVSGHTFADFAVYGDEASMALVRSALHEYQAMMPARIERIQEQAAQIATLEAENKRLRDALEPASPPQSARASTADDTPVAWEHADPRTYAIRTRTGERRGEWFVLDMSGFEARSYREARMGDGSPAYDIAPIIPSGVPPQSAIDAAYRRGLEDAAQYVDDHTGGNDSAFVKFLAKGIRAKAKT